MNSYNNVYNPVLGEIGCQFRRVIEQHISNHNLLKGDNVEWLLEPLDTISHSPDVVIDAFEFDNRLGTCYKLYFHNKRALQTYVAYDRNYTEREFEIVRRMNELRKERGIEGVIDLNPKLFDKTMVIKDTLNANASRMIPPIWDELVVPFTEVGIWQAVLLDETRTMFPTGWHANYMKKIYIFSKADLQKIFDRYNELMNADIQEINVDRRSRGDNEVKKSDYNWMAPYIGRDDIMPSVEVDGDKAVVCYCYWNDWSGFCRASIFVERRGKSVVISKSSKDVLFGYCCNIIY